MFPFVPRVIAKSQPKQPSSAHTPSPAPVASTSAATPTVPARPREAKGKSKANDATPANDEDLASLLALALSEHALWMDTDLRRTIAAGDEGWIPLSYLIRTSSYLARHNENALARSARIHLTDAIDVRMRVTAPDKSAWHAAVPSKSADDEGGYEVRRRDWGAALVAARNSARHEWEAKTVYVENVPQQHRTIPGIHCFLSALLPAPESPSTVQRIQSISLPAHHLDRLGDAPKCKGFALVVCARDEDARALTNEWPWHPRRATTSDGSALAAAKFGFRALSKARWDALNEEYLAYRQRLLDARPHRHTAPPREPQTEPARTEEARAEPSAVDDPPDLTADAPFPPGCLAFVRHVHEETNKTTLRALLATHAFPGTDPGAAIDYVDYQKGMQTCHVRLASAVHTRTLHAAFAERPVVQQTALDANGAPPEGTTTKAVVVELVEGTREALYWGAVPEKVRRAAVLKAVPQVSGAGETPEEGEQRKRKRRRKA